MTMSDNNSDPAANGSAAPASVPKRGEMTKPEPPALSPQAQRALAEAEERRKLAQNGTAVPREIGGRDGPDPVRYGDWEKGGIASDF